MPVDGLVKTKDEVIGVDVKDNAKENLGEICEVMLDKETGKVAYAVLDTGSFLGLGGKLFAIPWRAFHYEPSVEAFVLDANSEKIKNAPGFDKDHWPDMADRTWCKKVSEYYGTPNYWE